MKRILTAVISAAVLMTTLSGCTAITGSSASTGTQPLPAPVQGAPVAPAPPQGITVNKIAFDKIELDTLPDSTISFINDARQNKGYVYWEENGSYYIAIFAGQMPTGGYEIDVKSVEDNEGKTNIVVETSNPSGAATEILTYPMVIIKATGITDNFHITDTKGGIYNLLHLGC